MTNIVFTITLVISTNWITVSKTVPVRSGNPFNLIGYGSGTLNQVGYRQTNYIATGVFKGKQKSFILETEEDSIQCATRSIEAPADNYNNAIALPLGGTITPN